MISDLIRSKTNEDSNFFWIDNSYSHINKRRYWWLSPFTLVGLCLIILMISYFNTNQYYENYNVKKYINFSYLFVVILLFVSFILGLFILRTRRNTYSFIINERYISLVSIKRLTIIFLALTFFGYFVWFVNFVRIYGLQFQSAYIFHKNPGTIDGVTTTTQFGLIAIPCLLFLVKNNIGKKKNIMFIMILFLLAIIRAYIFSERLAFIELFVVFFVTYVILYPQKKYIALTPIAALLFMLIIFGAFEYFRSWSAYSKNYNSFIDFVFDRTNAYYSLSTNTNAMFYNFGAKYTFPHFTLNVLDKFSVLSGKSSNGYITANAIFETYGNSEYNNPGALAAFYLDYGFLGFPISFALGIFTGNIFYKLKTGNFFYIVAYSFIFLTMIELPRYFYLGNSRALYPLLGLFVLYFISKNKLKLSFD